MEGIRRDMHDLGVYHDVFSSELNLMQSGSVEKVLELLRSKNLIYVGVLSVPKGKEPEDWEEREQLLFKSTAFGDDVDRPLQKSDGSWTYFATDIAYHFDKIERGFEEMMDFWGSDHGGYVKRMQAAVAAISDNTKKLEVRISQIVRFMQDGHEVKMSKRAGTFITVRDIIDRVGKDVIRFIMLTRLDGALLDFDFKKVVEQSRDNPVFYVQYAYARTWSVFRQFSQTFNRQVSDISDTNVHLLDDENELQLIKILMDWPRQILMAAKNREPHRIAFYLCEVAAKFHYLWNSGKDNAQLRFVLVDDFEKTCARMTLLRATQLVIESAFGIIGVTPVKELR
jgi:arginyl-tRNA synthetase